MTVVRCVFVLFCWMFQYLVLWISFKFIVVLLTFLFVFLINFSYTVYSTYLYLIKDLYIFYLRFFSLCCVFVLFCCKVTHFVRAFVNVSIHIFYLSSTLWSKLIESCLSSNVSFNYSSKPGVWWGRCLQNKVEFDANNTWSWSSV